MMTYGPSLPQRYRRHFDHVIELRGAYSQTREIVAWQCRLCGRKIKPNTAGAQSHIAKHVREGDSLSAPPAVPDARAAREHERGEPLTVSDLIGSLPIGETVDPSDVYLSPDVPVVLRHASEPEQRVSASAERERDVRREAATESD